MLVHHEIMNGSRGFQEKVSFSCSSYYALKNRWWAHKFCFLRFLLTSLFCIEVLFSKFSEFRSNSWNVWRILSGGVGREEGGGVWDLSWRLYLPPVSTALLQLKGFWKALYHFLHQRGVCGFSAVTKILLLGRSIIFHSCVVMGGCISQMWWHNYTV